MRRPWVLAAPDLVLGWVIVRDYWTPWTAAFAADRLLIDTGRPHRVMTRRQHARLDAMHARWFDGLDPAAKLALLEQEHD